MRRLGRPLVSGMGELHLEIIRDRLLSEYNVTARSGRPQVVYRETVLGSGEAEHVFERSAEDESLFGKAVVRVTARPRGSGLLVRSETPPPSSDWTPPLIRQYPLAVEAALAGVREAMGAGPQAIASKTSKQCSSPSSHDWMWRLMSAGELQARGRWSRPVKPRAPHCWSQSCT